jgi:hypothetical protein
MLNFGKTTIYDLPSSMDPEGLHYTRTIISEKSFATLI